MAITDRFDVLESQVEQEIEELQRIASDATESAQRMTEYLAEFRSIRADLEPIATISTSASGFSVAPFLNDIKAEQEFIHGGQQ